MYKKISMIYSQEDAYDVYEEIEDRYGTLPKSVENLINISLLRSMASECGISEIKQKERNAVLVLDKDKKLDLKIISGLIEQFKDLILFSPTGSPYITIRGNGKELIENIKIVLQAYKSLKDGKK